MTAPTQRVRVSRIAAVLALAGVCAFVCGPVSAQSVSFSGHMGDKALLVIDGTPRTLAAGTAQGNVKLVSVNPSTAMIEVGGKRQTLSLGGSPVSLGGANSEGGGEQIVLTAGLGGHFITGGSINGKPVQFMVDTGATTVAMSAADADRIGLKYKDGPRMTGSTANGQVIGYRASLNSVRIGDVQVYNVEAAVLPMPMPHILLGNSFLTRFQMKRENDLMTLDKKP
ncbi:MAG: TIGR02281 family clan AA aspartic protease [Burkholderiaceae bacterium]|nr:TIGR02281 family clan AA aspartic protease [Burkholderiaceae bacterium]